MATCKNLREKITRVTITPAGKTWLWRIILRTYLVITWLLVLVLCFLFTYIDFDINRGAEYCRYVKAGQPYHVLQSGIPCVLQWELLKKPILLIVLGLPILQLPILAVLLCRGIARKVKSYQQASYK